MVCLGNQMRCLFWASWLVFAVVHTYFVSGVTLLPSVQGFSECLVWIPCHVESCVGRGEGLVQSLEGVLSTEVHRNVSSGLQGKPKRNGSTFQTSGTVPVLACNPDILDIGRMKLENWSWHIVGPHQMSGPEAQMKGVSSLGQPVVSSPDAPWCQGRGCCRVLAHRPGGPWAGLGSHAEGSTAEWATSLSSEGRAWNPCGFLRGGGHWTRGDPARLEMAWSSCCVGDSGRGYCRAEDLALCWRPGTGH